jgi:hypothetical protein
MKVTGGGDSGARVPHGLRQVRPAGAWAAFGLLAFYLVWPARESLLLTGTPFTLLGFALALALSTAAAIGRPHRWSRWVNLLLLIVTLAKVALVALTPTTGWATSLYASDRFEGSRELSTEFRSTEWTRLDSRLDYSGSRFPLHFFNDLKYNFHPNRHSPPFSAVSQAFAWVSVGRHYTVELECLTTCAVFLDGNEIARAPTPDGVSTDRRMVDLPAGRRQFLVQYQNPADAPRRLRVDVREAEATGEGGAPLQLFPRRATDGTATRLQLGRWGMALCDVVVIIVACAWLLLGIGAAVGGAGRLHEPLVHRWMRIAAGVLFFGVALYEYIRLDPNSPVIVLIQNGFDAFAYEDYARRTVLDGWLLDTGHLAGQAYLYMIGYHYVMTGLHALFGESLLAVYYGHSLMLLASIFLAAGIARRVLGWPAALFTCALGFYFGWTLYWTRAYVFRENLVLPLDFALVYVAIRVRAFRPAPATLLGLITAFNIITDFINVPLIPAIAALVWRKSQPSGSRRPVALFLAACALGLSLMPARNLIVTGWPTLMPTEGPPTLWWGNKPPPGLPDHEVEGDWNAVVLNYALTEPVHFLTHMAKKALYSVGFYSVLIQAHPGYTQFSLANLLAVALGLVAFAPLARIEPRLLILYGLCLLKWATIVVYIADHNVDRYETVMIMMALPLMTSALVLMWRWNRALPVVIIASLLLFDVWRVYPALGNYRFSVKPQVYSQSYKTRRREAIADLNRIRQRLSWNLMDDSSGWRTGQGFAFIPGPPPTYQLLQADSGGSVESPPLELPADAIASVEVEAGFTGWVHVAKLVIFRETGVPTAILFPIDGSGRVRTYRIPVARSGEWTGMIARVAIAYAAGDAITLRSVRLVPYPDVAAGLTYSPAIP